ncbi:MAG: hypothetical protein ABEI53_00615 [Candidatus Magasanikbacteria bacterium]
MAEKQKSNKEERQDFKDSFDNEDISAGTPWKLMIFTLVLFMFSVVLYLGLVFGYKPYIEGQIQEMDSRMEKLAKSVSKGEKKEFLDFYSQLTHLKSILNSRKYAGNVFKVLEENTLPSVYLSEVSAELDKLSLKISGTGSDLKSVVDQVAVFEKSPGVDGVVLGELSLDKGSSKEVGFKLKLFLSPSYLKKVE